MFLFIYIVFVAIDVCLLFFFFLMIRRPPRSTLFPSRRSSDLRDEVGEERGVHHRAAAFDFQPADGECGAGGDRQREQDRKSTRLNSSHSSISYAVFCLKKKKKKKQIKN